MIDPKKNRSTPKPKVIKPKIKPDAPNTQPGDEGNGHVLVVDARTQRFNGVNYRLHRSGRYACNVQKNNRSLHTDVWEYHNGTVPEGYVVHHEHRNPDGTFDKNENNIEWLRLMSKGDHSIYHLKYRPLIKRICPQCGKEFETNNSLQKYCTKSCAKRHARENSLVTRICPVCQKSFRVPCSDLRIACSDECEAELRRTKLPVAYEQFANMTSFDKNYAQGEMVMRTCPICGRAFPASRAKARIACSPECGAIVASVARAHRRAMEDQMHWSGEFLKLINKTLGVEIRTLVIKGEPWFVAKDVCDALALGDTSKVISRLDDDEKGVVSTDTLGGKQEMNIINEFGLYRLILESRKPEAEEFKRWIIHEVLPALRKYGRYVMEEEAALSDATPHRLSFPQRSRSSVDRLHH